MRPLTKNATNGTYIKYYPSVAFLPSVALGALLTTNLFLVISHHLPPLTNYLSNEQYFEYSPSPRNSPSVVSDAF